MQVSNSVLQHAPTHRCALSSKVWKLVDLDQGDVEPLIHLPKQSALVLLTGLPPWFTVP